MHPQIFLSGGAAGARMALMRELLFLVLGGSLGTVSRYYVSLGVQQWAGVHLPYGTLAVNLIGCLLIGILLAVTEKTDWLSPGMRLMLGTGFLGALTTFSTFEMETFQLMRDDAMGRALAYVGISLILGFAVLAAGYFLTRGLVTPEGGG